MDQSRAQRAFTGWHLATIVLLGVGYSGYYFCRSNLSVVLPDLIQDLARHGISANEAQVRLGFIASAGTVAYAVGKFVSGSTADLFGGRRNFLGWHGGLDRVHACVCAERRVSSVHAGVGGQPAVSIHGLGRPRKGCVALVLLLDVWHGDGGAEPELPLRRRGLPLGDERPDGLWIGLAGRVSGRGWIAGCAAAGQRDLPARDTRGARPACAAG